jgi:hypothetical protein
MFPIVSQQRWRAANWDLPNLPTLARSCQHTATVTEMVASTGEVHHSIAKKLSLAGPQRDVARHTKYR